MKIQQRGVAGVIAALFLFLMIFTAGLGYFLYQNQSNLLQYQANAGAISNRAQAGLERLSILPKLQGSSIVVEVNNTGGTQSTVEAAFIKNATNGRILSPPGIMVLGPNGATNRTTPLNLAIAEHGGIFLNNYTYGGKPVLISVLTSRGNIYSGRYPLSVPGNSTTVSSTTTISSISTVGAVGNPLVVVMTATPPQVFGGQILIDNITFYNFATTSLTASALNPSPPLFYVTGTATLNLLNCSGPYTPPGKVFDPTGTIPGYSGVGVPPHIYFLCFYKAHVGTVGGIASFAGGGKAIYNLLPVFSAEASSNIVQIGGLTNALTYGAFSINFFEFKYTSCTNEPNLNSSGSIDNRYPVSYSSPCTTRTVVPPVTLGALPEASNVSAGSNYYTAFYIQVTNNFNSTLALMQYTMIQFDQSDGGESDWWLTGNAQSLTNGVYYPNYNPGGNNLPTLAAYPNNCNTGPTPAPCFAIGPSQSQVLTLAACSYTSTNWDWGGIPDAEHFDVKSGCISSTPRFGAAYGSGSAAVVTLVISFFYKGHIFTQNIQFEGVAILP